jgi:hypothetical protein
MTKDKIDKVISRLEGESMEHIRLRTHRESELRQTYSYGRYDDLAEKSLKLFPKNLVADHLRGVHKMMDMWYAYRYRRISETARQAIELIIRERGL